jgi:dTDP-4-dehydrorhamnose reductase
VLGATGMLGRACLYRLRWREPRWQVDGTARTAGATRTFDVAQGQEGLGPLLDPGAYQYVINCIGIGKTSIDETNSASVAGAVAVNALFPHLLAAAAGSREIRVLSVSTDAVFSGRGDTSYLEGTPVDPVDVYGRSKTLGESMAPHVLNIRCSIVGRSDHGRGLTEWYLRTPPTATVGGYSDYIWTPVTVYQFADLIHSVLRAKAFEALRREGPVVHFAPNAPLSKFEYLTQLRRLSRRGARVEATAGPDGPCCRVLSSSRAVLEDLGPAADWTAALHEILAEDAALHDA